MGVMQHITYTEYLPEVVGPVGMHLIMNAPDEEPHLEGNGHSVPSQSDPGIRNEFATVAFRFGHAMVPNHLSTSEGDLNRNLTEFSLKDHYFDPDMMWKHGLI